ncbi:Protein of unknown function [Gryllus bimaculatus]|nr:Protein of unknown function [Gryllus bimaculatus]
MSENRTLTNQKAARAEQREPRRKAFPKAPQWRQSHLMAKTKRKLV